MPIVTSTIKGQIVIPADIRKKFGIVKGTKMNIFEQDDKIIVEPLETDPIKAGRGMLKSEGRVLKRLLADRKKEASR